MTDNIAFRYNIFQYYFSIYPINYHVPNWDAAARQVIPLNVNTQQMRYFMELAKCLNFTRAAANLYVAQPTLSQQIAELEAQLGVTLFARNSRSVALTPAGEILYKSYPALETQMVRTLQHMLVTAAGLSGSLTIGFLDHFLYIVPALIREFRNEFPDVAIRPVNGSLNDLNNGLKDQSMDVIFTLIQDYAPEVQAGFESRVMFRDQLCFVLSGDHPAPRELDFASSMPMIIFSDASAAGYYPYIADCLKKMGIQAPQVFFADAPRDIQVYLESGIGFSVLPSKLVGSFSETTRFIPIPGEYLNFGVLWDPNSTNPALPLFLDSLEQYLQSDPGSKTQ